jgi:hypothetical protein
MEDLYVGDRYPWAPRKQPQNGGRPDDGNSDADGYMECQHCQKDSFVRVIIRNDVIVGVEPNTEKQPFIPD